MDYTWMTHNIVEHARQRQAALHKEAARQRLLLQLAQHAKPFVFFRKAVLLTGHLLIISGTWLKQRAALEQSLVNVPTLVSTGETECYHYQPNVH